MRIDGRNYRDEWLSNAYPARPIGADRLRVSRTGRAVLLSKEEDDQLNEFFMTSDVYERLERTGHILTNANAVRVMDDLKMWLRGTYDGPGLHIVVTTRRCNLNCPYCHMLPQAVGDRAPVNDLDDAVIPDVVRFILSTPSEALTIEFQGGEPFLNFRGMVRTVEEVEKQNTGGKRVRFAVVSNLMVANDEQLKFCHQRGIKVSFTLNGPQDTHDLFRITRHGKGSYDLVMKRLAQVRERFPGLLASYPLCVVTDETAPRLIELFEYYYSLGYTNVGTIWLKNLGNALGRVKLNMSTALPHYLALLDYIYEKNKTAGVSCSERNVNLALNKILGKTNPLFIDWRNPIGYVSNCLVYDTDGEILPVDEARSLRDAFGLGNVRDLTYDTLIRRKDSFETVNLSIRDRHPVCRECAYNPYCGVSPVLHYGKTGCREPEPHVSDECKMVIAIFDWVFKRLSGDDPVPVLKMSPQYVGYVKTVRAKAERAAGCPDLAIGVPGDAASVETT